MYLHIDVDTDMDTYPSLKMYNIFFNYAVKMCFELQVTKTPH